MCHGLGGTAAARGEDQIAQPPGIQPGANFRIRISRRFRVRILRVEPPFQRQDRTGPGLIRLAIRCCTPLRSQPAGLGIELLQLGVQLDPGLPGIERTEY